MSWFAAETQSETVTYGVWLAAFSTQESVSASPGGITGTELQITLSTWIPGPDEIAPAAAMSFADPVFKTAQEKIRVSPCSSIDPIDGMEACMTGLSRNVFVSIIMRLEFLIVTTTVSTAWSLLPYTSQEAFLLDEFGIEER